MKKVLLLLLVIPGLTLQLSGQEEEKVTHLPVFDIHVHAMKTNPAWANLMCPWFLSNMPGGDPIEGPPSFLNLDCVDPLMPATSDEEMKIEVLRRIKKFNMTMVAFGDPEVLRNCY